MTAADHQELYKRATDAPARGMVTAGGALAVVGLALFVALLFGDDPGRAWRMFHVNFLFFTGVAQGAIVFAAIQKVTKGKWAGPIIRFAEATVLFLPISLLCYVVIFLGGHYLFPWIENPTPARGQWLTTGWVFWRDLLALLVVYGVSVKLVYHDLKPDVAELKDHVSGWRRQLYERIAGGYTGTPDEVAANEETLHRLAPALLMAYAWFFTLVGFDLIQSLAPYWYSNLFGGFFFISCFLTGLTMLGLMMVYWRSKLGLESIIAQQQFHDLGKLIFGFSIFWAYLMFSQLLVIWYGNLPEETSFIFYRLSVPWRTLSVAVGLMVFFVPFWGLIWVKTKITVWTFVLFLTISFSGVWLERYIEIQPSLIREPVFGLPEIGVTIGFVGMFLLAYGLFARAMPMVSPRLAQRALELHH